MGIRAADNRVASVLAQYRDQLAALYDEGEARAIARAVFQDRMGWDAAELEMRKPEALHESDLLKVYLPLKRLRDGEPMQHVLGKVWFHGLELEVSPDALIPRPETEELVDLIVRRDRTPSSIIDVCTGSGCIALALKHRFPHANALGVDISEAALSLARRNSLKLGLDIRLEKADALAEGFTLPVDADLIISNPPYIPVEEADALEPRVRAREPYIALFAPADDPLAFYRAIGGAALKALAPQGELWFEGHWRYVSEAAALIAELGFQEVILLDDLSGKNRFIHAIKA
ncbi:MAG: peptide chain release factor N(5)-glutamine methyltransferase [Flavobacteriales bacterium]|nr:peptide chain release factor N(5)-glutamine methyltransferase [Flavobacteriales bacterium]